MLRTLLVVAACEFALNVTVAAATPASPSPSATATPADPCGGPGRLLATLNRPTVGFSACAVAAGTTVVEAGYQTQRTGSGTTYTHSSQFPQADVRFGIKPRFELDVLGPNYGHVRSGVLGLPDSISSGAYDYGVGFKYELPPTKKFTVGFDGLYTGPNGSPGLTAGNATVGGNVDISYAIDDTTGIGTTFALSTTGGFAANGTHGRYGLFMPSLVITKQVATSYQLYAEYVYASRVAPDVGGRTFLDYGVQKLLGTKVEVDAELGQALTGDLALKFHYVGVGFGVQLR